MSINLQLKSDYSYLFGSLGASKSGGSPGNLNFLSDYASIKNGSYGKLMKAYYAKETPGKEISSIASQKKHNATGADTTETLAKVQSATDSLKESADALLNDGNKSVFQEKESIVKNEDGTESTVKSYDKDAIYKAVSKFVSDYNSVLDASDKVNSTTVLGRITTMVSGTAANAKMLENVGITIGKDNALSIDKDTFMAADMGAVKNLFHTNYSYGYRVSAQASFINFAADNEAAKSNTYNWNGAYTNNHNTGNIFNQMF